MASFRLNALIAEAGIAVDQVRLLRHETKLHAQTPYSLWRDNPDRFNDYQRIQSKARRAWFASPYWASFVVTPDAKTMFAGMFAVAPAGALPPDWIDPISLSDATSLGDYDIYDSVLISPLEDLIGRLVIDWGEGKRSWAQRAIRQDKPVVELRERFIEPAFPGYATFVRQLSEINSLPPGWRDALSSARGVYLLTCPRSREQYVGSATGNEGFLGRWRGYLDNGHGGNAELKIRGPADYRVSILQVAGSADDRDAVLAMEGLWKAKLQSREMGLNRN